MGRFDIVIVGNGALGLSLAYALTKQDPRVKIAVVGPAGRRGAASTVAGAMINVWAELADGQFDNSALADRAELAIAAIGLWDALCAELSEFAERELRVQWGTYLIQNAIGSPHESRTTDYIVKTMRARDVPYESLRPEVLPWLKPAEHAQIVRLLRIPDGRIDARLVIQAYERALLARGVTQIDGTVHTLIAKGSERRAVLADATELSTEHIVLANGAFAQALIDQNPELKRATPRLLWGAGSALDLALPENGAFDRRILEMDAVARTVDRGGSHGAHIIPYGDGKYYFGASSGVFLEPEWKPRADALRQLLRSLTEEINTAFADAMITIRGPGFRPTTIDAFPLLGQSHIPGIWFASGTKRDGFTCSPFIARELARAILGGQSALPARFTPSRKLISYKTRTAAITDAVTANLGSAIQRGLTQPDTAAMRSRCEQIYEKRGMADFGIHPELIQFYENDALFAAIEHLRESVAL